MVEFEFCTKCGCKLLENASFCMGCGNKLTKQEDITEQNRSKIPDKSTIWATSKWHIYRIGIEKETGYITSVRRWTRNNFEQFGTDTYFSDFQRVSKRYRGVSYLEYTKDNNLQLATKQEILKEKTLSREQRQLLKDVKFYKVMTHSRVKTYSEYDFNKEVVKLIERKKLKYVELLIPHSTFPYEKFYFISIKDFLQWSKENLPKDASNKIETMKLKPGETFLFVRKNDFEEWIKKAKFSLSEDIYSRLDLNKLKSSEVIKFSRELNLKKMEKIAKLDSTTYKNLSETSKEILIELPNWRKK